MRQQPDNSKNLVTAMLLSLAVVLGWQYFVAGPKLREEQARIQRDKQVEAERTAKTGPSAGSAPLPSGVTAPGVPAPTAGTATPGTLAPSATAMTRDAAIAASPRLAIKTPSLEGSIDLKGAHVDDLRLVRYHDTVDPKSANVVLFSPLEAPEPYFAEYGWLPQGTTQLLPTADTVWKADKEGAVLTPSTPVTLTWDNGQGLVFHRTISVDNDYMLKVLDEVENQSQAPVTLAPYGRIYRLGKPHVQGFAILHEGLIGVPGEAGLQEFAFADAVKENLNKVFDKTTGGWLGVTEKYWASALIPGQADTYKATFGARKAVTAAEKDVYYTDYVLQGLTVPPSGRKGAATSLYAGAKQVSIIDGYEKSMGIKRFDRMIDWGWFYFITKPLFYILEKLNAHLHNFGLSILALTLLVKAAFFPLANKSYESMAKMKKLQPQVEALRERYKDDKARQQQEMMTLYGKEKINPAAGCLPILLQIPVFFALYKVLFVTIDMRHAPFFGWIKDLSAPDPTTIFNLFGLIPWTPPEFFHVGAWALIMGVTMWLQMQLNPPQPDPVQQQVFAWMPVIFTFMLASFPVGLVIYWAWNNLLSILQQAYIMKKQGTANPIRDNLAGTFAPLKRLMGGKADDKKK